MSPVRTIRRYTTLALLSTLATPAVAFTRNAGPRPAIVQTAPASSGGVVKRVEFDVNGRRAYAVFALVPAESTRAMLELLAKTNPDNITLGVKDDADPILDDLKGLALNPKNIVEIDENVTKTSGVLLEKDRDLKARFLERLKEAGNEIKTKRWNTVAAFGYAGTVSIGQVYVMSGSLTNAAMTFAPIGAISLFAATQSSYGQLLNASGRGMESVVAKTFKAAGLGKELDDKQKRYARAAGQFLPIYSTSLGMTALVTHLSGQHIEFHHLMIQAFANNYPVWDAVVAQAITAHVLPHAFEMPYFLTQYVVFTAGELAAYQGVPGVEVAMAVVSGLGLTALLNPQYVKSTVEGARVMMKFKNTPGKAKLLASSVPALRRRLAVARLAHQISGGSELNCDLALSKVKGGAGAWTPSYWRAGIRSLEAR